MTTFNLLYAQSLGGKTTTHIRNYFSWIPADYIAIIENPKGKTQIRFFKSCYTRAEYNELVCKFYSLQEFYLMDWYEDDNTVVFYTSSSKVIRNIIIKIRKERKCKS